MELKGVELPAYEELAQLGAAERNALMRVREGSPSEQAAVELVIRRVFVWAIVSGSSDVHISSHGDPEHPAIHISIRSPKGMVNLIYEGEEGRHFAVKLFQLTNTPQGGSTPDILDTRFRMVVPTAFARKHGLRPGTDRDGSELPYRVDIRVAYVRTFDGFAFVCRLLDQQRSPRLEDLGWSYTLLRAIHRNLQEPSGLILVSGPTGSGKTTTLAAMLKWLINGQRSVVTIENPVEVELPKFGPVKQIPVGGDITFESGLRAALRLDPDVILVGEIRDKETMEIALKAAQTGHLVFATVHANSAAETLSRALDLTNDKQRDAFLLAELVKFVVAQRLVDRHQGERTVRDLVPDELAWFKANGLDFMHSISEVKNPSRAGKVALVEAFAMTPAIKSLVRSGSLDAGQVYRLACEQPQYETLAMAGVRAIESKGCRVQDCMMSLETTSEAGLHPGLRARLARTYGATLSEVDAALEAHIKLEADGLGVSIEEVMLGQALRAAEGLVCADANP